MTEQERLIHAKFYADKLANGIDPITDRRMPEDSVLNQVQIARFFFFISNVLDREIHSDNTRNPSHKKRLPFSMSRQQLETVKTSDTPVSISELSKRINEHYDPEHLQFSYRWITEWLIEAGFLSMDTITNKKAPTISGKQIGIFQDQRYGHDGQYLVILYNKGAQQFILDNMDAILEMQGLSLSE